MSNYTLWWFVQPTHLAWFALVVGLLLGRFRIARWLGVLGATALLIGGFSPLADWITRPLEQRFPAQQLSQPAGIIVLAGAEQPAGHQATGDPHFNGFADRLTTFVALARRYPEAQLVHSGGGYPPAGVSLSQSDTARAFLLSAGLGADRVLFEKDSRNTYEGARETAAMLGERGRRGTWLVVTSAFHMPRAIASFRAAGLNVAAWPTDFFVLPSPRPSLPQPAARLQQLDWAAHEWVGLAYYRMREYTDEFFPSP